MAKAGAIVSGISSIVGVIAAGHATAAIMTAAEVTAITGGAALALGFGIPIAGAVIGLALGDALLGKREEKRGAMSYLATAACSLIGLSLGAKLLGDVAVASSGLVTEQAIQQTLATQILAEPIKQALIISTAGKLLGGLLGAIGGAAIGNKIAK